MRVVVTGHNGYIGSVMVSLLRAAGHEVAGLDTFYFEDCVLGEETASIPVIRRDIRDVTVGLNELAGQIDALLSREREQAADLSHRLRTPLTVLRLEAETLRDPAEAGRIGEQVDVLERTVTELINATRRPVRTEAPCTDATAVVAERVRFWSVLADEQDRRMDMRIPSGPLLVRVRAEDLSACLDALLGNVFAHTPEGGAMRSCRVQASVPT